MNLLEHSGSEVSYYDPFVPVIRPTREHPQWAGTTSVRWDRETLESFDAAIVVTAHRNVDYQQLVDWSKIVIDTRNATKSLQGKAKIVKA
jgi:UDP-N-acetyl-D-glucosamine dehydrogenase